MGVYLKKIIPLDELKRTIRRFPLSTLCSLALFVLLVLSIHDFIDITEKADLFGRLMVISAYGFFWFVLARLFSEGNGWGAVSQHALGFGVFAILILVVFLETGFSLLWMLALMVPALLLGISAAPYLNDGDDLSFWFYNSQVWQGAAVSILAGLLWGAGISAALASVDYLFGVNVAGEFYADLWSFALMVFAPLYALSWVPERYQYREQDCHAPPQLAFILNWVLAPLIAVYMLILYAYFIKIAMVQELPRGQLSYMVTAFGGLGVLTYLAGWPLRDTGGPLLRLVHRFFFPALFVPVVMQALSIYQRIDQYGVTEQRYVVVLSVVWFGVLALGYSIKKPPLKMITGLLAIMLVVAALGPFSAPRVAERSQLSRLETLLMVNGILVEGKISRAPEVVSFGDRKSISSILTFLQRRNKLGRIGPWLPMSDKQHPARTPQELTKEMGFAYISHYERRQGRHLEMINLRGQSIVGALDVSGFDYLIPQQHVHCFNNGCSGNRVWRGRWQADEVISATYEKGRLSIAVAGHGELVFDVQAYFDAEVEKDISREPRDFVLENSEGDLRVRLIFLNFNARKYSTGDGAVKHRLQNFAFRALVSYKG